MANEKQEAMEKLRSVTEEKQRQVLATKSYGGSNVWDCGSTLYDSFELNSFKRQLDSAMSMSMPEQAAPRKSFKLSRSLQKLVRSIFKSNNKTSSAASGGSLYVVFDNSGPILSTIPQVPQFQIAVLSPEISSFVRRSASERFTPAATAVPCTTFHIK